MTVWIDGCGCSLNLFIYLFIYLFIHLFIYLFIYLFTYLYLDKIQKIRIWIMPDECNSMKL